MPAIGTVQTCPCCPNVVTLTKRLQKNWGDRPPCTQCRPNISSWNGKGLPAARERLRVVDKYRARMVFLGAEVNANRKPWTKFAREIRKDVGLNGSGVVHL
jgi:hypothetical protein